jgi:uncharacterized RDD family membrane protein YckC
MGQHASRGGRFPVATPDQPGYRCLVSNQAVTNQADDAAASYPGKRFGLPEEGPRSVAGIGRRLGALLIDWLLCDALALGALHTRAAAQLGTLILFAAEVWLLTGLTGFSIGKRVLGIRVARIDGKPVGLVMSALRTILLLLVVPALVLDKDLRGLHDKASRTIVIRT